MTFNESNTVEQMVLDACVSLGWRYVPAPSLPRQPSDVFVESLLRQALIRLNPEIAAQPDRADEVIYKLRAILLSVQNDGLVRSNEALAGWLQGDKTMPFGPGGEHTPVRLIDFENPANNDLVVCNQWTYKLGQLEKRLDVVLLVNGLPIVVGEAKTPVRPAVTWVDGAAQVHDDYEQSVPAMFVPNVFSFATEGKAFRYGSVRMPIDIWGPWRSEPNALASGDGQPNALASGGGEPNALASGIARLAPAEPRPTTAGPRLAPAAQEGTLDAVRKSIESMFRVIRPC